MTKRELIKALEPFTDDIDIVVEDTDNPNFVYPVRSGYRLSKDRTGLFVIRAFTKKESLT